MKETIKYIHQRLKADYSEKEIQEIIRCMFEEFCHIPAYRLLLAEDVLSEIQKEQIYQSTERLLRHEPIQYIIGNTFFCDHKLNVTPDVLIPRPETVELVRLIIDEYKNSSVQILDVGTGSGCIAIGLAAALPESQISALDVSAAALEIARNNGELNRVAINWMQIDILSTKIPLELGQYDCIVSNPPYVMEKEKKLMKANVLDYEPHLALFVPDNDPLLFYRRIAQLGNTHLKQGGKLYFEINEQCGQGMIDMLKEENYKHIELLQDFYGKDRIMKAEL